MNKKTKMTLHFNLDLPYFLKKIGPNIHHCFLVHKHQTERKDHDKETLQKYHDAKWAIVDLLNINQQIPYTINLYNWLHHQSHDEIAYFLSEAGSNTLNYAEFKAPSHFEAWLGKKGIILGITQQGTPFNPTHINNHNIKENEGAAFDFFRNCNGIIFFDHPTAAQSVYYYYAHKQSLATEK